MFSQQLLRQCSSRRALHVSRALRGDEGSIRSAGGSFGKKEQAQEDLWAHKRDLQHLKELQEKLKKAHTDLETFTKDMIEKTNKK